MIHHIATRFADLYSQVSAMNLEELENLNEAERTPLLAAYFDYHISKGGFAQLLYNLQGNLLAEIEEMLITVNAPIAQEYYVQAIETCLIDEENYQLFLASDYLSSNPLKDTLHKISIDYFSQKHSFVQEIKHIDI